MKIYVLVGNDIEGFTWVTKTAYKSHIDAEKERYFREQASMNEEDGGFIKYSIKEVDLV